MKSFTNRVQLIGNLGHNPEVVKLESGKTVARFSLATNENYKSGNGTRAGSTQWHNLVAWGHLALITRDYLNKGARVAIDGRLEYKQYKDKNGMPHYNTEVVVLDIMLLETAKKQEAALPF